MFHIHRVKVITQSSFVLICSNFSLSEDLNNKTVRHHRQLPPTLLVSKRRRKPSSPSPLTFETTLELKLKPFS